MRWIAAWTLFWLGDGLWSVIDYFELDWAWLYRIFNELMVTSFEIQGDGPGPWKPRT